MSPTTLHQRSTRDLLSDFTSAPRAFAEAESRADCARSPDFAKLLCFYSRDCNEYKHMSTLTIFLPVCRATICHACCVGWPAGRARSCSVCVPRESACRPPLVLPLVLSVWCRLPVCVVPCGRCSSPRARSRRRRATGQEPSNNTETDRDRERETERDRQSVCVCGLWPTARLVRVLAGVLARAAGPPSFLVVACRVDWFALTTPRPAPDRRLACWRGNRGSGGGPRADTTRQLQSGRTRTQRAGRSLSLSPARCSSWCGARRRLARFSHAAAACRALSRPVSTA
jgi:hypothetical protein